MATTPSHPLNVALVPLKTLKNLSGGRASVPRAKTAGGLLYAKETNALGVSALIYCYVKGGGKLVLAWLAGRSPYRGILADP